MNNLGTMGVTKERGLVGDEVKLAEGLRSRMLAFRSECVVSSLGLEILF